MWTQTGHCAESINIKRTHEYIGGGEGIRLGIGKPFALHHGKF
jgi:hypothetical protein